MTDTSAEPRLNRAVIGGAAIVVTFIVFMYWEIAGHYWQAWITGDTYHHCLFVLPVVGWLIWRKRERLAQTPLVGSWSGLPLLLIGVLLYVVAMRTGVRVAIGFSFPILILGLAWTALGTRAMKHLAYPLVLLFFLVPVPMHILGHFGMPLQMTSAAGAAKVAHGLGLPVGHDGIALTLHDTTYAVAEECSGLNSMLALFFGGAVLAELIEVAMAARLVLLLTPGIILVANTIRLTSVLVFAEFAGPEFALDSLIHGGSDVVVYLAAFGLMWLLFDLASERRLLAIVLGRDEAAEHGEHMPMESVAEGDDESEACGGVRTRADCSDLSAATLESVTD
ncbi:MAG: exosortase [Armatimonadia bacterium]|nr:exosortase [Armatimonadia bacterium]